MITKVSQVNITKFLFATVSITGFFLFWDFAAKHLVENPFILPSPIDVMAGVEKLFTGYLGGNIFVHIRSSLYIVMIGYLFSIMLGVPLGIMMAWNKNVDTIFSPLLSIVRPIPPPAWIPLAILWFGIDASGKVFVIIISSFVPCVVNSYLAVKEQPQELIDASKTLGATRTKQLMEVVIPSGLPTILTGMRIALGNSWATVVAAELVVASSGLGFLIQAGYRNFEANIMAASMIAIAIIGFSMNLCFRLIENWVVPWRENQD